MRYVATDDGDFIDTETGERLSVAAMMAKEGMENVYKDKGGGTEDAGTDKENVPGQAEG